MTDDFPLAFESDPPATDEPDSPGVVLLHGRGADEADLLGLAAELPDELHVLSVRAPDPLGPGYTWYELDLPDGDIHRSQPDADDYARSRAVLDEFVERAVAAFDLASVGLFGFSQGAILAMGSVLDRPDRYGWAVALHGYLPAAYDDVAGETPVFLGAGEADDIIPASRVEDAADRLRAGGLDVTFRTYPAGHGIGPDELADATEWVEDRL
ncbi:MAG: alpha/beta hydrolase [Halobacteriaceae archaeon]